MVRLKAESTHERTLRKPCFNSTMVRLKDAQKRSLKQQVGKFQFHNGSIKSRHYHKGVYRLDEFQFHNGSIKSALRI